MDTNRSNSATEGNALLEVLQESDSLMAAQGKGSTPGTGPRQDVGH
jgi:hypothetical protein